MPSPLDYVTRLSLTFEQANLDYARGYARIFAAEGDRETAAILKRIYRDEIGHVHYGLTWFRRWKERKSESDWRAFTSRLEFPLSAARAKGGFDFNEEGRREAGLDEEFIRELKVYAQSKGRTPNVFWFNPGAEESWVPGWDGRDSAAARQVGRDLALLPAFLARKEDVVIVPELPSLAHRTGLWEAGLELPELVTGEDLSRLRNRKLHELRPWARTPDAVPVIESLGSPCALAARELFSKARHTGFLARLRAGPEFSGVSGPEEGGTVVKSMEEARDWLKRCSFPECVAKAPFSTAGRDRLIRPAARKLSRAEEEWMRKTIGAQGELVMEPWLERVLDFSIQYDLREGTGLRRRGWVVLDNTRTGRFRTATVAERFTDFLDEPTRRSVFAGSSRRGWVAGFFEDVLEPALESWLTGYGYFGPLGVDAFLYRGGDGEVRLKPVVEINPRFTMGRVAVELARFTPPQAVTSLTIQDASSDPPAGALRLTPADPRARFAAYLGGMDRKGSGERRQAPGK